MFEDPLSLALIAIAGVLIVFMFVSSRRRKRDAETTMRAVWCYLAYLSGASLDEQVRALEVDDGHASDPPSHDADRARRYRNRIYKIRERGRKALNGLWTADPSSELP